METTNISAVGTAPKHKWLSKGSRFAKKAIMIMTTFGCMACMCATQAFAATGCVPAQGISRF